MKIFIGMKEIAGFYNNLQGGFDELGIESFLLDTSPNPFGYGDTTKQNWLARLGRFVGSRYGRSKGLLKVWWYGCIILVRLIALIWAIPQFDTFIFVYGTSFFYLYDLPLLKWLGKNIIFMFHGSDARAAYLDGSLNIGDNAWTIQQIVRWDYQRKKWLQRVERYADTVVCHPMMGHFFEKPIVIAALVGIPFIKPELGSEAIQINVGRIRIVHAPSNPIAKGTPAIRKAIQALKDQGHPIDFIELTGRPHREVLAELAVCDFVIDQLYSDTVIAGLATEAAFMGKPSVTGTYHLDELKRYFPPDFLGVTHLCHPDNLQAAIEQLIVDRDYRLALGERAKAYMEQHWYPTLVAQNLINIAHKKIDDSWICDPHDLNNIHGWGLEETTLQNIIRSVIDQGGHEALHLKDKPQLEAKMIQFAHKE